MQHTDLALYSPHNAPHHAPPRTPPLKSKLPADGSMIFSRMSALAQQHDALNLGQGFPDFACASQVTEYVSAARVRYDAISRLPESPFFAALTGDLKVAALALSALYRDRIDAGIVRFCFANKDQTRQLALTRLAQT
jgi:aspartate/methionine/tyrosine aminotransferase